MVTIPIDNTSVNPARSFGAAIFSDSDAWVQLWAFIVFPLIGAVLGVFIWLMIDDTRLEETMVYNPALAQARGHGDECDRRGGRGDRRRDRRQGLTSSRHGCHVARCGAS